MFFAFCAGKGGAMRQERNGRGVVYLVEVGPGGPELMTVLARRRLNQADCVVYDESIAAPILAAAPAQAEKIRVGGSLGGRGYLSQEAINHLLGFKAGRGMTVVRLKGGYPLTPGCCDGEAVWLTRKGVRFEIIPGVSVLSLVAAYAGIPPAFPGLPCSLTYAANDVERRLDWAALGECGETLFLHADGEDIGGIADGLVRGGRSAGESAAVVSGIATPRQSVVAASLGELAELNDEAVPRPALIVVGKTVQQRERYAWFESLPFFGRRVLLVLSDSQSPPLEQGFGDLGAMVSVMPVCRNEPAEYRNDPEGRDELSALLLGLEDMIQGGNPTWVLFTSQVGVRETWKRMRSLGLDSRIFGGAGVAVVGVATAQELAQRGIHADLVLKTGEQESLFKEIKHIVGAALSDYQFVVFAGDETAAGLAERLDASGAPCRKVMSYHCRAATDSDPEVRRAFDAGLMDAVSFDSGVAVRNFARLFFDRMAFWLSQPNCPRFVALDKSIAAEMAASGIPVDAVAEGDGRDEVVEATARALKISLP